ncbi:MAG: hypothetical protein ACPGWR_14705 [Ardenticatenaceae bacterium]
MNSFTRDGGTISKSKRYCGLDHRFGHKSQQGQPTPVLLLSPIYGALFCSTGIHARAGVANNTSQSKNLPLKAVGGALS